MRMQEDSGPVQISSSSERSEHMVMVAGGQVLVFTAVGVYNTVAEIRRASTDTDDDGRKHTLLNGWS